MKIKSNTIGKLEKIRKGTVFPKYGFILELLQNAQRAKAKNVYITVSKEDKFIKIKDDGSGCKNPEDIFTLDSSKWETTTEGFGIGFWSCMAYPCNEIYVSSKNWSSYIDVDNIFLNEDLEITMSESKVNLDGFEVLIFSNEIESDYENLIDNIRQEGALQLYNVYVNEEYVEKKDIFEEVNDGICGNFENRLFKAKFKATSYGSDGIKCYYERRYVRTIYPTKCLTGVLELKPNAVTLKEPDRREIIYDEKRYRLDSKINECAVKLYKSALPTMNTKLLDEFDDSIASILSVNQYQKMLKVSSDMVIGSDKKVVIDEKEDLYELTEENSQDTTNELKIELSIDKENYSEEDAVYAGVIKSSLPSKEQNINVLVQNENESESNEEKQCTGYREYNKDNEDNLLTRIRKTKKKMWVDIREIDDYEKVIAKAEYYGFVIFKSINRLYDRVFEYNNVPHISELENLMVKTNIIKDVEIKNYKEERLLSLLKPICKKYNIPENTFKIANLEIKIEISYNNKVIAKEIMRNTKKHHRHPGMTDGTTIYLDRRCLNLSKFNLTKTSGENIGINDLKILMQILPTVCHELAHLLYFTTDNTKEHFEAQEHLYQDIVKIYID